MNSSSESLSERGFVSGAQIRRACTTSSAFSFDSRRQHLAHAALRSNDLTTDSPPQTYKTPMPGAAALSPLNHTTGTLHPCPRGGFNGWTFGMETSQAVQYRFRSP